MSNNICKLDSDSTVTILSVRNLYSDLIAEYTDDKCFAKFYAYYDNDDELFVYLNYKTVESKLLKVMHEL